MVMQSLLQGRTQLRPFLPAPSKLRRGTNRVASTCRCSLESSVSDRRTLLAALLSLGFAARADAKTAAAPAKKDTYEVRLKEFSLHVHLIISTVVAIYNRTIQGDNILAGVTRDCEGSWWVNIASKILQAGGCPEDGAEGHHRALDELTPEGSAC